MATERLGMVLSTATAAPPKEFVELGKIAEDNGFEAMLVNEGRGDALACAEAIALGTSTIKVGTNIANIYFRHPFLAAMSSWTISELSDGRLILGLGISHRRMVESLGVEMNEPREYLRSYVQAVKDGLAGESTEGLFRPRRAAHDVPVLTAALTAETARVGGALGDGIMPFLPSRSYLTELVTEARGAATTRAATLTASIASSASRPSSPMTPSKLDPRLATTSPPSLVCRTTAASGAAVASSRRSTRCSRRGRARSARGRRAGERSHGGAGLRVRPAQPVP